MKSATRPYRNQRLFRPKQRRQQHLLEVSLRADKERIRRVRRAASFVFKVLLFVAMGAGAWVGTKQALRRLVWENPAFYLSDVRVSTDGTLTREQVLNAGGIVEGRNILQLNLSRVRAALDSLPQVERVEVQRTFPNRLDVIITERQPIAWFSAPGDTNPMASDRSFLLDAHGVIMRTRKIQPDYYSLPVISGAETGNFIPGQRVAAYEVQAALELLRLNADSTRWQVLNIDVAKGYCLVVTDRRHAKITFGLDNIDKQIGRLYRILDVIEPTHREIQTVNLFVDHNTPVTFADQQIPEPPSTALPGTAPEAGKTPEKPVAAKSKPDVKVGKAAQAEPRSVKKAGRTAAKMAGSRIVKKPFRP